MQNNNDTRKGTELAELERLVKDGFLDGETGLIKSKLLDLSPKLANRLKSSGRKDDTVNQFRKFFNQVLGLQKVAPVAKVGIELRMLKARMNYAVGRGTISHQLGRVIDTCIDGVIQTQNPEKQEDSKQQLKGFCQFFESLYAYYYSYSEQDKRRRYRKGGR
jgi:CRISPR type III-A-associated protein Csm2